MVFYGFHRRVILNTAKDHKGPHRTAKDFKKTAKDRHRIIKR